MTLEQLMATGMARRYPTSELSSSFHNSGSKSLFAEAAAVTGDLFSYLLRREEERSFLCHDPSLFPTKKPLLSWSTVTTSWITKPPAATFTRSIA